MTLKSQLASCQKQSTWKTIELTAMMVTDNSDLEEGVGDMGFNLNDYEGTEELPLLPSTTASLLPPHC